jgi:hypothetical protein
VSPWLQLNLPTVEEIGAYMGVFQVRPLGGQTVLTSYAGGKSPFGIRGELLAIIPEMAPGQFEFRYEVTSSYLSRCSELRRKTAQADDITQKAGPA